MKKIIAGLLCLLGLVAQLAFAQNPISTTKHNLSAAGPGTVKSATVAGGGTLEICVFCHTPHGSSALATPPLWNRTNSAVASYTLYGSDYLTSLNYPIPIQPNTKSKLCLSCHDGTMGLGAVLNRPGSGGAGTITMATGMATMPATAAGHLGVDLANDHPVGFLYQPGSAAGQDPELVTRAWPWTTTPTNTVTLDPNTASGRVECHTCHDPHNKQFTKFLRMNNTNAAMCTQCHAKTGYGVSSHATSVQAYTPTVLVGTTVTADRPATTVGEFSCRGCHRPHTAPGKPLLRGAEEVTCYNAGCHGTNNALIGNTTAGSGTTWRNIQIEMNKVTLGRAHTTNTVSGRHKNLPFVAGTGAESPTQLENTNRHAECQDCHNPHQMQKAAVPQKSTRGNLRVSLALKGVWGVQPIWTTPPTGTALTTNAVTFTPPTGFTVLGRSGTADLNPVTDEYQVCMKCHSNYVTLPLGARNIAQEINPGNSSYHGMVPCPNAPAVGNNCTTNYFVNATTMAQPWGGTAVWATNVGNLVATPSINSTEWMRQNPTLIAPATAAAYANRGRVWCSDCHGSNAATMPPVASIKTAPYGPHGSTLTGNGPGTTNSDRMLVKTITSSSAGTPLCLGCHLANSYTSANFTRGYHGRGFNEGCFSCHMWDNASYGGAGDIFPHGMNRRWAARVTGDTTSVMSGQMVDSFLGGWYGNINYTTKLCSMKGAGNPCGRSDYTEGGDYGANRP